MGAFDMFGITRQRLANIKLTSRINLTGGKAKAVGVTQLAQSVDSLEIKDLHLNQIFCDSSFFIYKTMKLSEVTISIIDKEKHIAHLKARIELSEPKCDANKEGNASSGWASFFTSRIPSSRVETVDMDVPYEMNEDESKVKVCFSTLGLSQKITATII